MRLCQRHIPVESIALSPAGDRALPPLDRTHDPPFGGSCLDEIVPRLGTRKSDGARPLRNRRSSGMATATAAPIAGSIASAMKAPPAARLSHGRVALSRGCP